MELSPQAGPENAAQRIRALPKLERQCLAVLAAVGPQNRTSLASRLRAIDLRHPPAQASNSSRREPLAGRAISPSDLKPMLGRWRDHGLVESAHDDSGLWLCRANAAHALLLDPACSPVLATLASVLEHEAARNRYYFDYAWLDLQLARARLAFYAGQPERGQALLAATVDAFRRVRLDVDPIARLFPPGTPAAALSLLPHALRIAHLRSRLVAGFEAPQLCERDVLAVALELDPDSAHDLRPLAVMQSALAGSRAEELEPLLGDHRSALALEARAVCALRRGAFEDARTLALAAFEASRGPKSKRKRCLSGPLAPLLAIALATGSRAHVAAAAEHYDSLRRGAYIPPNHLGLSLLLSGGAYNVQHARAEIALFDAFGLLLAAAFGAPVTAPFEPLADGLRGRFAAGGAHWLAAQCDPLLRALRKAPEPPSAEARQLGGLLVDMYEPEPAWSRALARLEEQFAPAPNSPPGTAAASGPAKRLAFLIHLVGGGAGPRAARHALTLGNVIETSVDRELDEEDWDDTDELDDELLDRPFVTDRAPAYPNEVLPDDDFSPSWLSIEPRLQTRRGNGWTAGRAVALRTLATNAAQLDYLTPEDQPVLARLSVTRTWYETEYSFSSRAALALVGHPRVFWAEDPQGAPVEVVARPPTLRVERRADGVRLRIEPVPNEAGLAFERDLEGRLVVVDFSQEQANLCRAVADLPPIPPEGEERLGQTLALLARGMTVQSDLGIDASGAQAVAVVPPEPRPVVSLQRAEPGLRVRVRVQPLGFEGPEFAAGSGLATVAGEIAGRRLQCERDLHAEQAALATVLQALPQLEPARAGTPLVLDRLEDCLQLLRGLAELGDAVLVRWPEGKPVAVVAEADLSSLRLQLTERGEWLAATGTLQIDETVVLDLVQALAQRTADGGFLALGEDRYLALSGELSRQLAALQIATSVSPAKDEDALRLSPIALGFVSPWLKALQTAGGLSLDRNTKAQLERIERAYADTPLLPATFEGELRAYQRTGYEFLARLASFGAGACLADDMGLGKTPMTLALLIARAALGPALVVTPLSVRANWFDEALRFAPTLRLRRLEGASGAELDQLGAFDVLVCSYNVMALRIEQLEHIRWATLVLDEAQAIKNAATQRAMAARRLLADARVALTGTPVENHLGDLHGIMSFLNPGLLGSAKQFEARFAKPIQRDGDARAAEQLRALVAPFVLRRRKAEVLRELPPRTEISLRVEPGEREQAFSEALRRTALARLREGSSARSGSAISILAEITRLRRAACHPQLIDPKADVGAAKLERLLELAHELRDGGHRALVFSQFVDFLSIVRERLQAEGFRCQYLDGSTTEAARKRAVTAFQSGQGDLFLISLKAGGFGLNLTAADYVIHLDPWWNPAVEAQASDRAHRIGQERPVTIYRLVNAASIEERVLALHARKQALAEELLRESSDAARLDPEALMALLEG